jgi:glucose 1-dehydrogenase
MRLQNKVALITGAASGIGKAMASRFAAEGASVAFNYREGGKQSPEAIKAQAAALGPNAIAVAADVSKREDIQRMLDEVVSRFGRLDIAVSNAGVEIRESFLDVTDEHWQKVLSVNLYGAFVFSQVAARQMVKQGGGGRIIFTSSVHEDIPLPDFTPYSVSKGGIRMLMRNICYELAPHKITVNNIAPGAIVTPINAALMKDPQKMKAADAGIPLQRFGTADEVASVALFLASDESSYVTGSTYFVDGGLVRNVTRF